MSKVCVEIDESLLERARDYFESASNEELAEKAFATLLHWEAGRWIVALLMHPFVLGELAMGNLTKRTHWLKKLRDLPQASIAPTRSNCMAAASATSMPTCSPPPA